MVHVACACVYLTMAVLVVARRPGAELNRVCGVLILCFFHWSACLAVSHHPSTSAATAELFAGRLCIICPTPRTPPDLIALAERLWSACGARPLRMDAALHDRVLGAASHLPHVAAYALSAAVGAIDAEGGETSAALRALGTTSLRDTTRIAASSPAMWRDIFLDNRAEMLPLIDRLAAAIAELRAAIAAGDGAHLDAFLDAAREARGKVVPG